MDLEYDFAENRFTPWDYVVFAVLLAISSVIGLYYGCTGSKQSSTDEFLMAGRSMGIFPVALSLLASFMSAITLLGTPAEIAAFGTQYWMIWLSYCFVIPLSAYVFVPVFYRLNLTSVFEVRWPMFHSETLFYLVPYTAGPAWRRCLKSHRMLPDETTVLHAKIVNSSAAKYETT
jgi:Sodium:solute symporter family